MPTARKDWSGIAASLAEECPSATLRQTTAQLLERLESVGRLGRGPKSEFRRVYESLKWNDADRLNEIIVALVAQARGQSAAMLRVDSWNYVIGVLDEWIIQARIFYLVSGILETALRARIDARLTDVFGTPYWPYEQGAAPSGLHEFAPKQFRDEQLLRIHAIMDEARLASPVPDARDVLNDIAKALEPAPATEKVTGAHFLREMTFGGLRMFFEKKESWGGRPQLQEIFRNSDEPPNRDKVSALLRTLNDARNDLAHYRPDKFPNFEKPLYSAALLARSLGGELQHIYGSIDTRDSTELSTLLAAVTGVDWRGKATADVCTSAGCDVPAPFQWMLQHVPADRDELLVATPESACLFHRVENRDVVHRPRPGA